MLCVLAFFSGDKHLAVNLANWIERLGGVSTHDCLLVVDKSTDSSGVIEPLRRAFKSVIETSSEPAGSQGTWGTGTTDATAANEMWLTAGDYVYHKLRRPWMWLESDAVPMRSSWLDEIENEYTRCRKPFMGAYVNIPPHEPHMSGNAVYPVDVAEHSLEMKIPNKIAWDYAGRRDTVGKQKAHFTQLIQHEYRVHGEAPTFPTRDSLKIIRPGTAIFHRCKDSSLIDRLREIHEEKRGATAIGEKMTPETVNPLATENEALKRRLEEMDRKITELVSRKRIPMPEKFNTHDAEQAKLRETPVAKRPYTKKQMKKKRVLSPEHLAKLQAGRAKAHAASK